ncbi:hypothetical protein V8G54_021020, partial [Vigna mungo]
MEEPTNRTWMYARLLPRRKGYRKKILGVKEFIDFACRQTQYLNEGVIRCPCKVCKNDKDLVPSIVNTHIHEERFAPKYWYWTFHGEKVPHNKDDVEVNSMSKNTSELSDAITMLNMSQASFDDQPQLIQTQPRSIQSHSLAQSQFHSTQLTQPPIQSQSQSQCHATQPTQPQPENQYEYIPTKVLHLEEYPMVNKAQTSSSSQVSEGTTGNKIMILPEGDGFDQHKLVVRTIASIIRTNLEEAKPSRQQLSIGQRNLCFNIFKSKFTWPPQYKDMVRRNFEKRGSAKMTQLMQD